MLSSLILIKKKEAKMLDPGFSSDTILERYVELNNIEWSTVEEDDEPDEDIDDENDYEDYEPPTEY